jgi:choline dehydrogenase-like flavoprotein
MTDGAIKDIAADKEVILAAGAINCPKLLMLSGVGEATALRSLGIDVVENRVLHDIDSADPQS